MFTTFGEKKAFFGLNFRFKTVFNGVIAEYKKKIISE